jgi:hypothetical protein
VNFPEPIIGLLTALGRSKSQHIGTPLDMAAVYRPHRKLQKVAPKNFDAALNLFI